MNVPNNKKKRIVISVIVLAIIGVFVFAVLTNGRNGNKNNIITTPIAENARTGTRTIMIYLVGSDLESQSRAATLDVQEMIDANIRFSDVNVVIYAGGSDHWFNEFENNNIYELTDSNEGFKLVETGGAKSMGEASTLTDFMKYVYDNYKTDLYSLILWDHGAGPIGGFGVDEVYDSDMLTLAELEKALRDSPFSKDNKLEIIGFDACLMATIEVAAVFDEYADFLVASQDIEPGLGWDYTFLNKINKGIDSVEFGKSIVDEYLGFYEKYSFSNELQLTMSLTNLSKLVDVEDKIDILFKEVGIALNDGKYSAIVKDMTKAKCFQCYEFNQSYDLIDLYGTASELKNSYGSRASDLLAILDQAIVYQKTNVPGANGLSIYYPYNSPAYLDYWLSTYNQFDFAPEYKNFINNFAAKLLGIPVTDWDFAATSPVISTDGSEISIQLDEKVVVDYHKSRFLIFKDTKDGYYSPRYESYDTTLTSDGTLIANYDKRAVTFLSDTEEDFGVIALKYEDGKDYVIYRIMAVLQEWIYDENNKLKSVDYILVDFLFRVDAKNPNGKIIGVIPCVDPNDPASTKKSINLADYEYALFPQSRYKIFDDNGNYTWNWGSSSDIIGEEVSIKKYLNGEYVVELAELEKGFDYYCLFIVFDTQGNRYTTNVVKFEY